MIQTWNSMLKLFVAGMLISFVLSSCLHNGCTMSKGLSTLDVDSVVSNLLNENEYQDNVIKAVSWNIRPQTSPSKWTDSSNDVCQFLKKMDATFLGLQEVDLNQLSYLKSCMKNYAVIGKSKTVLAYKTSRRMKMIRNGHFQSGKGANPSECTWMRVRFAGRSNENTSPAQFSARPDRNKNLVEKMSRLFNFLIPQSRSSDFYRAYREMTRIQYTWINFFVAVVKINAKGEREVEQEIKDVLNQLKNNVMRRRRYPIILLVDLGDEDNSLAYKVFRKYRLINAMENAETSFPMMSQLNQNDPSSDKLSDFVFNAHFNNIVGATLSDEIATREGVSKHRPVLAAVLRRRRN